MSTSLHFGETGISEGVCSIIHAAPRTELKGTNTERMDVIWSDFTELHILREILMHKYGREFSLAVIENRDACVSERVSGNSMHQRRGFIHPDLRILLHSHAQRYFGNL